MSTAQSSPQPCSMTRTELVFVTPGNFLNTIIYGRQPTTEDIALQRKHGRFVLQKIGDQINVYATDTLRHERMGWTIGVPKFVTDDFDAAVMWAMLQGAE